MRSDVATGRRTAEDSDGGKDESEEGKCDRLDSLLATLLVLSFAAMPGFEKYSVVADRLLVADALKLVLALSVLVVRNGCRRIRPVQRHRLA